ncbi:MAG TPA: D-glycerate dehydrogenase, partial [Burkholderiales bacterium]|nr:D-glycerate dehydrogenase [Burkholderiales bacterium]
MKPKILVTRELFDETIAFLEGHFEVEANQSDRLYPRDELIAKLKGKEGVQTSSSDRIDGDLLDQCP